MPISSTSTLAEIDAAYIDNSDYAVDGSVEKAKEFAKACRLLLRQPAESNEREGGYRMSTAALEADLKKVDAWLDEYAAKTPTTAPSDASRVRYANFRNYRN